MRQRLAVASLLAFAVACGDDAEGGGGGDGATGGSADTPRGGSASGGESMEGGAASTKGGSSSGGASGETGGKSGSGGAGGSSAGGNGGADAGADDGGATASGGSANPTGGSGGGPSNCDGAEPASDDSGTTPGVASLPFPTLEHLSVEWLVEGDTDLDASVNVRFRPVGEPNFSTGMPLRRIPAGDVEGFSWPNKFGGSLFGLEPGTTYEVELSLSDPDGGCELRTLEATTRSLLVSPDDAPVIPVTPDTFEDAADAAQPGDILELGAGSYAEIGFPNDGTANAPIVLRGTAGAIVEGDVRLDGRSFVIVEGLEVHGQIKFNDSRELAIVRCRVIANEDGIVARTRSENLYIADNVVTGVTEWVEAALGVDGDNLGEGILVTGPGHVIEHNRVSGFRDAISLLEDDEAADQFSIDILRNDISEAADDGVEADFCFHDCRILENRLTNTFIALSSQPGLGGPTYFVRNVVYNTILSAFKLQRGSVGDVGLHNTVIKSGDAFGIYTEDVFSRQYFRNNLFLGGPGAEWNGYSSGEGDVLSLDAAGEGVDLDYDGYGSTLGSFSGRIGETSFESLDELRSTTTEVHAVEVDLATFAGQPAFPESPFPGFDPVDVSLAVDGAAVEMGATIPNINDDFVGPAPDLGALELYATAPSYGPRP